MIKNFLGIAILLVIIGHTMSGVIRGAIFSFHMPLFFILSCMTYRWSKGGTDFIRKLKKSFVHLIVPVILLLLWNTFFTEGIIFTNKYFENRLLSLLFSSGVEVRFENYAIWPIGLTWFLVALFWGRTLFDYLHLKFSCKLLPFISVTLSVIGVYISKYIWLPFSFDIVLAIMIFLYIGSVANLDWFTQKPLIKSAVLFCIWGGTLVVEYISKYDYLELAAREYVLFPLCYVTAMAGSFWLCEIGVLLSGHFAALRYLGENSLVVFCIHYLDYSLLFKLWSRTDNDLLNCIFRLIVDIVAFLLVMKIKSLFIKRFKTD